MTSNINPNNIDGTYPVAGQDNNSQGFRDNFTNTKTNFQYASDEITDLQNNAILKSALTGTTLDNDMLGSLVYNGVVADFGLTRVDIGTVSGSQTINYALGHFQTLTTGAAISLAFSNFPAAGVAGVVYVQISVTNTSYTVTLPSAVSVNARGIQGLDPATNIINDTNKELQPFNHSAGVIAASGASNLALTTEYFTTAATGETNTLAAGVNGQIKVLAYYAEGNSGDTRIVTVSNAGWKSSGTGTVTFTEFGQTATMMYINSKWFAISVGPGASDTFPTLA